MLKRPNRPFISIFYKKKINANESPLIYGNFGFISLQNSFLSKECVEATRVVISKIIRKRRFIRGEAVKKKGSFMSRLDFLAPITKKGTKSRMGKGKGAIKHHMAPISINDCLFEIKDVPFYVAYKILKKISYKLGIGIYMKSKEGISYYL